MKVHTTETSHQTLRAVTQGAVIKRLRRHLKRHTREQLHIVGVNDFWIDTGYILLSPCTGKRSFERTARYISNLEFYAREVGVLQPWEYLTND